METYLTIKELSKQFKISLSSLYRLASEDPSFPAINIGLKKKIIVNQASFHNWMQRKNYKDELIKLPSNTIIFRRRIHETPKY